MRKALLDLHEILGEELLAKVLNRKKTTLQKFIKDPNQIPSAAEDKINFLSAVVRNLEGSYTRHGIRRWLNRERDQLHGKRPMDLLSGNWWPRHPDVLEVLMLSSSPKD